MHMNRRQFFKIGSASLVGSSIAVLGFSPTAAMAEVREFKLARATETRNNCPYCSVSCGVLVYSVGDKSKNVKGRVIHIEGDPDDPVNRGSLCPKGAGLMDMVNSPTRLKFPEVREPGSNEWKRISWHDAFERIAKHMKADRDANFIAQNAAGVTVNRWNTMGFLASSSASNESGYLTHKVLRSLGAVAFDTQARI
jgi:formate dehydrogenase major subunit